MAANLSREFREECARRAWDLRVERNLTLREIAAQLPANPTTREPVSEETVRRWLDSIEERLSREFVAHAEQVKARQTAQLEHFAKLALEQWYLSCGEIVSVVVTSGRVHVQKLRTGAEGGGYTEESHQESLPDLVARHTEVQTGNPALLAQARDALADVRALWGLNAPRAEQHTGAEGGPVTVRVIYEEKPAIADGDHNPAAGAPPGAAEGPLGGKAL